MSENDRKELSEKLNQMSEDYKKALPKLTERLKQLYEQNIPEQLFKFSEQVKQMTLTDETETSQQETVADVTQKETPRSEIREGEREQFIVVEETAISKAFGADNILRDRQGRKSIAIRAEDDEVQSQTHGLDGNSPGNELKELKDLTEDVKISEQETRADVTQEETQRSEIREGESERFIYVQETAISKAFGADKRLRDRQGKKSLVIRKTNTEDAGVQTHGSDVKAPGNELKELK
ncbi:uncharacterized protein LOC107740656 [Sinocyclocheilus rhinocerous]|uniref:uncharacterized protein LOC107740656 n=1 Tax=Sinocyclocheilus rhinocerous TaxID=307959 RepID=UPI0007BA855D|nr:PREDICTED: uncharacterized protein LOC107740656 [Sinocyclocheilus rhinocerous]